MDDLGSRPALTVRRLDPDRRRDFDALMDADPGCAWCRCVAWWVPTWEGFGERSAEENRGLRAELFARGEDDGYLGYQGDRVVAWCQAGPRDRLAKLVSTFGLAPDPEAWALTCFHVAADARRRGLARGLLVGALADLDSRGVRRVEAYPRRGADLPDGEAWTGPESLFAEAGFAARGGAGDRVRMVRELRAG